MLKIAVCDDNRIFANTISSLVQRILRKDGLDCVCYTFNSGEGLLDVIERGIRFDLLFLDIKMPGMDGKEVAATIRENDRSCKLVFVSSFSDEVYDTFAYGISSFLPKSMVNAKLENEVHRIAGELILERDTLEHFTVVQDKTEKSTLRLRINDMVYFELIGKSMMLHTTLSPNPYDLGRITMSELSSKYASRGFFLVHRSILLNMFYVYKIGRDYVQLTDKSELLMSRRRKGDFESAYFAQLNQL